MDALTILGWVGTGLLVAFALYITLAMLSLAGAIRVARSQEEIPKSLDCRDGSHAGCPTCSCRCHT